MIVELTGDPVAVERAEAIDAGEALSAAQETQVQQDLEGAQKAVVGTTCRRSRHLPAPRGHAPRRYVRAFGDA